MSVMSYLSIINLLIVGCLFCQKRHVNLKMNNFLKEKQGPWGAEAKDKYLPLLNVDGEKLASHECAISYMLGGRAFYISSLAAKAAELGRLINQLHLLATVRLAAFRNIAALHAAGTALFNFGLEAQKARDAIFTEKETRVEALKTVKKKYNEISRQFTTRTLAYRVERAKYYYSQWESAVSLLDTKENRRRSVI